ncbi:MAG: peptide deformylase, partial [Lachnospiraceae bacterium]
MEQPIIRDTLFLRQKARPCGQGGALTKEERQAGEDLLDTLRAKQDTCVGLAANMIGKNLAIIAVSLGPADVLLYNPVIISRKGPYQAEEGCLSLDGVRKTLRYQTITVTYRDGDFAPH